MSQDETPFTLDRVSKELTVIISTSIGDYTPSTDKVRVALESLQANVALKWCRRILSFDKVPSEQEIDKLKREHPTRWAEELRGFKWERLWREKREAYEQYCQELRDMKEANHPLMFKVELVFLDHFGHLFGTVQKALEITQTPYVFVTQHDLKVSPKFVGADVQRVLDLLSRDVAHYVALNRDVNNGTRTMGYFRLCGDRNVIENDVKLTGIAGFSDQSHFAKTSWYRRDVLGAIPAAKQLTCMEHFLHESWKNSTEWRRTFLYGGPEDGPFSYDLVHGVQVRSLGGQLHGIQAMPERAVPT